MPDFAEFIERSTRRCKGGDGCMCCWARCDCGCVLSCPVWLRTERNLFKYNNLRAIGGKSNRHENER